jgi:hypothetical protein
MPSRFVYFQMSTSVQCSSGCTRTCVPSGKLVMYWPQNSGGWSFRSQDESAPRGLK